MNSNLPTNYVWIIIIALCVMVVAMRCSFLVLPRRWQPKGALAHALSFAPLAALMAICAPEVMKFQVSHWPVSVADFSASHLFTDWRLLSGSAMVIVVAFTRKSRNATLYGLIVASMVIWAV
jgi:branched-subunit amino acid transport protein